MIGNDIVDVKTACQSSNWHRPGYLGKLFTDREQALIHQANDPEQQVWLLWACKEAAYKAWSTEFHQRRYAPRSLQVVEWSSTQEADHFQAVLHTQERTYMVKAQANENFISSSTEVAPIHILDRQLLHTPDALPKQRSTAIRQTAAELAARHFQCRPDKINIRKNELGRPILYYLNEPQSAFLSWSHHGAWAEVMLGSLAH
ncbi:4'-phosphopantetheinyl transferase superfamily protein [Phaeodactylibacter sp.]|jgi:phosphopantetheinyl transferase (holo-ACP synthase)|uniref:4'-phosphopantetheinyl transferase superfamily protein n=1 Tax=Phaeodactylibacter sp. TaxID=1940289 RepID=UPI0025F727EF|nr:4'-phosphopantetheinyl transferase superfamily protein [Phaeodactylibacter sp.]MCI4646687.1 4'-phosphopantetheinyl transferase superfamily protein [Phaeodactylibacter sp.]MCI5090137.1 4'-phosphopantetheinyl transferase superfamily protein [Phaeodactylibacter sp.]